ncbi:hypothetical protein INH39_24590 [Massilia violaceinigra]|uniref:Lipoprotein n=1 Tax=Massilia violaceinigra TaxID=2045208 RepID=A0ABY4A7H5_9BURK|nr:hypothetical protein [Massilia violaceinigra]UOD28598.1 hypothetical protein INH39_24590 [Massilia violaceinigra]
MHIRIIGTGLMALACSSLACAQSAERARPQEKAAATVKGKARTQADVKPDGFGTVLPAGLNAKQLIALVAPGRDASFAMLVGAKAWPYRANSFVVIACFSRNEQDAERSRKASTGPSCDGTSRSGGAPASIDPAVYFGVVEYQAGSAAPTLVASYGKPYDIKTSWAFSQVEGPGEDDEPPASGQKGLMPEQYRRFDFAPYKITPMETAIGLRLGWNEGYAGGGADFEALSLLRIDGNKLVNILSEPVSFQKLIAGDWNKDGTRQHDEYEGTNVLSVLPSTTNGYADLQLRLLGSKSKQVFTWDSKRARYMLTRSSAPAKKR